MYAEISAGKDRGGSPIARVSLSRFPRNGEASIIYGGEDEGQKERTVPHFPLLRLGAKVMESLRDGIRVGKSFATRKVGYD